MTRNEEICARFGHATQEDVAKEFNVSRQRIGQIWRRAGLVKTRKDLVFLGAYVSREAKAKATAQSHENDVSVSRWLDALILREEQQ